VYLAPVNPTSCSNARWTSRPLIQRMAQGELDPFDGPLSDNTGTSAWPPVSASTTPMRCGMCWFVAGIFEPGTGHRAGRRSPLCDGIR
jgi:hypothetical protein